MLPRCYTLTHSDRTGDLFLTIASDYDRHQISGWYTRLMRDEILAQWSHEDGIPTLHVHCHVSGGIVLGSARWRMGILRHHMPQVIQAFRFGDHALIEKNPDLDHARIWIHFHARQAQYDLIEDYGSLQDYEI